MLRSSARCPLPFHRHGLDQRAADHHLTSETHHDTLSLASLAASSFAATQQLAAVLNEREFTLLFHEGRDSNLHVAQVTDQVLLVITFGRETQVGKVRLYTSGRWMC